MSNYTKNPLLVRVFHELSWVEDMGSGTLNILRYAPLYYPDYMVEISNGSQFIFSITYMGMSQENMGMSQEDIEMSQENMGMSQEDIEMSQENLNELNSDELSLSLENGQMKLHVG